MMQAEKKYKVAAQMGNQGHSGKNYFQFKAWVDAGIIKNVTKITAFMNGARRWHGWNISALPAAEPIPTTLNWDEWLNTAEFHQFNHNYVQGNWRCWYDFGNGALGDWGAHILDTAHQFLHLGLPEEINAVKLDGHSDFIFPQASTLSFKFPKRDAMPPV
jgi:predicted dehydrogenase